ncbi:hypothetical protein F5B22DRAFT_517911 [Xylaria bambusicola]|uniref:uncharacterized protein n=1 Tax=Xylaria bambusicola TaxID=326684 RepID=UPI002007FD91|nr:uncharacterized protein F5B22DRAFT_517911 [Xylaria bambusicola]KAI0505528.1 hypothetical protein F5B22DRAFT_517911 [Xylaria bambusicola]
MCLHISAMCPKTKTKSRADTRKSSKKTKCRECRECHGHAIPTFIKETPVTMYTKQSPVISQIQTGYYHGHVYGYGDPSPWEHSNPAMISNKQWRDQTQAAQNAYASAQENGTKIDNAKGAITSDINEAQKAIQETHASVNVTDSHVKDTRDAVDLAQVSIKETQLAVLKTQDTINDNHAEQLSKQEACAADVARVRQLLEEEAKKREEAHRVEEMVRYAQSQGLLQTHAPVHQCQASTSSSPATSVSSSAQEQGRQSSSRRDEEWEAERRRQLKRDWKREQLEHHQWVCYSKAMDARLRLQAEQERCARVEGELDSLRRSQHPRFPFPSGYPCDDVMEAPPYNTYLYPEPAPGGSAGLGHRGGARTQLPRRGHFGCGGERMWD